MRIRKVNMPDWNIQRKCPYALKPDGTVVHNTANDASAMAEISYMQSNTNYTSFHFAVDDTEAVQGVELNRSTWHAGDGTSIRSANRTKLSVEICYSKSGGERFLKAERNAARLIAMLCKQYGWGIDKVSKHQDYKATKCPHRTLEVGWNRFLDIVKEELGEIKPEPQPTGSYAVRTTTSVLNIRRAPTVNSPVTGTIRDNGLYKYTITAEQNGFGKLKSGAGWISLEYTTKS